MILPKDEIKFVFNPYILLPGDILLMNTYEEVLRKKMGCKYEHVAIYIGDAQLMEANGVHVVMNHIYSYAFREQTHACVLRYKNYSSVIADNIARNARKQMGREYINTMQFRNVRLFKNLEKVDDSNRSFCSRLVAQSYNAEGINIVPNADYCEPDDFLKSDKLKVVSNAVVPFTEDLSAVVMNNQQKREDIELDSPNAELFKELGVLYGLDIQDLGQALLPSQTRPELNDKAIEIVKKSRMFKHMDDAKRNTPWIFDNQQFLDHYSQNTEGALHFLYSNMNHYDNTIILYYRELHMQMVFLAYYFPKNTMFVFLRDYIAKMVEEAILCRKRFAELFMFLAKEKATETAEFIQKYGLYTDICYTPKTIDISFLLNDIMKVSKRSNS